MGFAAATSKKKRRVNKGIALLKESYLLANAGETFQMPESISSVEQTAEYARQQIESARKNLKRGEIGKCARGLLEVALIVVTPMKKSH